MTLRFTLSGDAPLVQEAAVDYLVASKAASRLREADPTLWGKAATAEASERLGWVAAASDIVDVLAQGQELISELSALEYEQVLLCGMGGSSLAPQVMTQSTAVPLVAVDSIHPDFIARVMSPEALARSIVVVSSKSGGTSETRTQLAICEDLMKQNGIDASQRIIVITDPDSELEEHARLRGYRTVLGHPHVGGRYSALTVFGMVPAMLAGADLSDFAPTVFQAVRTFSRDSADNPAIQLASALKVAAEQTGTAQFSTPDLPGLPSWIEQLIAESTGKDGRGLLPIARDKDAVTCSGGMSVILHKQLPTDPATSPAIAVAAPLGVHFYFWEVVASLLCVLLEVNPFDQPDVERTKRAARGMKPGEGLPLHEHELSPGLEVTIGLSDQSASTPEEFIEQFLEEARTASYVVIQAFVPEPLEVLDELGRFIEAETSTPTAVSYGPSYLHSTGQLHKGGQPGGLFMNIFQTPVHDIAVPGTITSLGWLCASAAMADQKVLRGLGRSLTALRISESKTVLNPLVQHR